MSLISKNSTQPKLTKMALIMVIGLVLALVASIVGIVLVALFVKEVDKLTILATFLSIITGAIVTTFT